MNSVTLLHLEAGVLDYTWMIPQTLLNSGKVSTPGVWQNVELLKSETLCLVLKLLCLKIRSHLCASMLNSHCECTVAVGSGKPRES